MEAATLGYYFDRYRVMVAGQDFAGKPGNVLNVSYSMDGGLSWVDGFSENHMPSGVVLANRKTIFRIRENIQYNQVPIDWSSIDYDNSPVDIQLITPSSQYGPDVYANPDSVLILPSVAWSNETLNTQYGQNVSRDLEFFVTQKPYWFTL